MVLLFDIDGTLLFSGGAGKLAMERAMMKLHGEIQDVDIPVHGRTDRAIIEDLLAAYELPNHLDAVHEFYSRYVCELPEAMESCEGYLLPGVIELLNNLKYDRKEYSLGILTGNGQQAAQIKLGHFALDHFDFGGYGENNACRNEIAKIALNSASNYLRKEISGEKTVVIGDTIHDIRCARSINAKVVAVGTGTVDQEELKRSEPDLMIEDFSNANQLFDWLSSVG